MDVVIDLPPVTARLLTEAEGTGASAADLAADAFNRGFAIAAEQPTPNATEELFRRWDDEDAGMIEEDRQAEGAFWEEFSRDIDGSRATSGMRLLF
jgi:hypothetical protein